MLVLHVGESKHNGSGEQEERGRRHWSNSLTGNALPAPCSPPPSALLIAHTQELAQAMSVASPVPRAGQRPATPTAKAISTPVASTRLIHLTPQHIAWLVLVPRTMRNPQHNGQMKGG